MRFCGWGTSSDTPPLFGHAVPSWLCLSRRQAITPYDPDKDEELTEIIEGYDPDSEFKWLYKGTMYLK